MDEGEIRLDLVNSDNRTVQNLSLFHNFNHYPSLTAFDKYYADPVNHRPPTVYIGFP